MTVIPQMRRSTKLYIYVFYYYDTPYGLLLLSEGIIRPVVSHGLY